MYLTCKISSNGTNTYELRLIYRGADLGLGIPNTLESQQALGVELHAGEMSARIEMTPENVERLGQAFGRPVTQWWVRERAIDYWRRRALDAQSKEFARLDRSRGDIEDSDDAERRQADLYRQKCGIAAAS